MCGFGIRAFFLSEAFGIARDAGEMRSEVAALREKPVNIDSSENDPEIRCDFGADRAFWKGRDGRKLAPVAKSSRFEVVHFAVRGNLNC